MYRAFYGLKRNPFSKEIPTDNLFISKDLLEFSSRMEYFKQTRGFALCFGRPGIGKTTCIRHYTSKLNPQLFKVVYLALSSVTVNEFYRNLAFGLDLEPSFKKVDMFHAIQNCIINLKVQKKQVPFIILDEGQFLGSSILNELRLLFNFQMDSKDHAMVLLSAQPVFLNQLNLHVHEPLRQRTVVHHEFRGLDDEEVGEFVKKLLAASGRDEPLFTDDGLEALCRAASRSPRMICTLAEKSLILGAQKKVQALNSEIVQDAYESIQLFES